MNSAKLRILVGIDFSPVAELAFQEAIRLAKRTGGTLEVVHVVSSSVEASVELLDTASRELLGLTAARGGLVRYFANASKANVPMTAHLRMGTAGPQLLAAIAEIKPDLVVLGSHGHSAVRSAFVGSVSNEVWRASTAQVILVPPAHAPESPALVEVSPDYPIAWSCRDCGHIFGVGDSAAHCTGCGADAASWFGAVMKPGPVDALLPAIGHAVGEGADRVDGGDSSTVTMGSLGTSGANINPELRVRY